MLPVQAYLSIFGYLDNKSLLICASTNHSFRELRIFSILRQSLLNVEVKLPTDIGPDVDSPLEGQQWPCYACFRLLKWERFCDHIVVTKVLGPTVVGHELVENATLRERTA